MDRVCDGMIQPELPPPDRAAFLLDLDGTLLDIAPTPDAVVVAPGLARNVAALRALCGDAVAFVTGRPIEQVDALFPGIPYAVAGEHGTAIRHAPEGPVEWVDLPSAPPHWVDQAQRLAEAHPGAVFEPKRHGFVLHYRGAPGAGGALHDAVSRMLEEQPGRFDMLPAKMAWEVRPRGVDKGTAVRLLMAVSPFAGRLPVFVGDDVTDEDGISAAEALGGVGLRVPDSFGAPEGVRAWIARLAGDRCGDAWPGW